MKIINLIALSAVVAFAQTEFMLGPRVSIGMNRFTSGYSEVDKDFNIKTGLGFGAGIVFNIPIKDFQNSSSLTFNPELNLLYRTLYSYADPGIGVWLESDEYDVDMTEYALSIPLMFRFKPGKMPFYLAAGAQADIPFNSEFVFKEDGRKASLEHKNRSAVDFGVALGAGVNITNNLSVDFRWVKGLLKTIDNKDDKSKFDQFSVGIAYLFSLPKPKVECPQPEPCPQQEACPEAPKEEKLESFSSEFIEVYKDSIGTTLSMSDLLFEKGKAKLKDGLKMTLTELAGILKIFLIEYNIVVEGHTDNVGSAEYNQALSEQRAQAVLDFLADRGVNRSRLKSVGHNFSKPIADNETEEGRAKNRRVEIVIIKNANQEQ
jgi:outer membrane protein OmpA-like peptidoglycan-associated protein